MNIYMSDSEPSTPKAVKKQGKSRHSSGLVRESHLIRGAFLVEFETPAEPMDMCRRDMPVGLGPANLQTGKERQSAIDQYRTMERKGFRVTKDTGCLIPDEQYGTYQQGATVKGHQRSFAFFAHWVPKQGKQAIRNEWGWPEDLQISHLCHRRSCCRIDHLLAEEQWRNLKRNYCGSSGGCDCGNPINCLRRYQMQDQTDLPEFCLTKEEVEKALDGAPSYVIHSANRFTARDDKSKQRRKNKVKRKRKQELHKFETDRKQRRLSQISE